MQNSKFAASGCPLAASGSKTKSRAQKINDAVQAFLLGQDDDSDSDSESESDDAGEHDVKKEDNGDDVENSKSPDVEKAEHEGKGNPPLESSAPSLQRLGLETGVVDEATVFQALPAHLRASFQKQITLGLESGFGPTVTPADEAKSMLRQTTPDAVVRKGAQAFEEQHSAKNSQAGDSSGSSGNFGKLIRASHTPSLQQERPQHSDRASGSGSASSSHPTEEAQRISAPAVSDAADQAGRTYASQQAQTGYAARTECALCADTKALVDPSIKPVKKWKRPGKDKREHLKRLAAEASQAFSEAAQKGLNINTTEILESQSSLNSRVYLATMLQGSLPDKPGKPKAERLYPSKPGRLVPTEGDSPSPA